MRAFPGRQKGIDKKLELLLKTGWHPDSETFTRLDLVSLVKFVLKASAKAKEFGPEYLVEKSQKLKS